MAITRDQARSLFNAVVAAKNVQSVSEGFLGLGHVPTMEDFTSRSAGTLDKCEAFTAYLSGCIKLIDQELHGRERQGEIDFEKPGSKGKKKKVSGLVKLATTKKAPKKAPKKKVAPTLVKTTKKKKGGAK